jgi:CubicO group peptidase (beta-lactamase class C family)
MLKSSETGAFLKRAIRRHEVPGASFAVLRGNKIVRQAQAGTVNTDSGVPVTPDAVFQIGSITKPLTATLVMQMVDEGLIELDAPIVTYLPEFRVARADVGSTVTVRELLSHTSGIDGDFFIDSGLGDDAIRRFLDRCAMVPSLFERGEMMSYCNLGFAVLGRLLEVMRRRSYGRVMQKHLFAPLGMDHAFASPEQAIRFNCAIGHLPPRGRQKLWQPTRQPYLSFGQSAAGSVPSMSAADLLQVARLHLNLGRDPSGSRLLRTTSVRDMQHRHIKLPRHTQVGATGWGLGWILMNWRGEPVYGHDGATIGQFAFMRIFPQQNLAFALLTNGGRAGFLFDEVCNEIISPLVGTAAPMLPEPARRQPSADPYVGRYGNMSTQIDMSRRAGRLRIHRIGLESGEPLDPQPLNVTFIDRETARIDVGDEVLDRTRLFFTQFDDDGKPHYLQTGFRQFRRLT